MVTPRAIVLRTAGTNCDLETGAACAKAGIVFDRLHMRRVIDRPERLREAGLLVLPGGFTYGDDLGAGSVMANELRLRLGDALREFLERGGLALGICNGFQILVKAGLLPDPAATGREVTLTDNDSGRFEARWVRLRVASTISPFFPEEGEIELPVAHGEGKFVAAGDAVLDRLETGGQVVFRYAGGAYPANPNGSARDIAGICDPSGRILGLMPHPERYQAATQHYAWTRRRPDARPDGLRLFEFARRALSSP